MGFFAALLGTVQSIFRIGGPGGIGWSVNASALECVDASNSFAVVRGAPALGAHDFVTLGSMPGGVVSLEAFGAVGDGVHDDGPALTAALAALAVAGGGAIQLGADRTYLVSSGAPYSVPGNASVVGYGETSILKSTANATVLQISGDYVALRDFWLQGSGAGAAQSGVVNGTASANSGFCNFRATNVRMSSFGQYGMFLQNTNLSTSNFHGPQVTACLAEICTSAGFYCLTAEYTVFTGCAGRNCTGPGLLVQAGNVLWTGGDLTANGYGVKVINGTNPGHGVVSGANINHNTYGIWVDTGVNVGESFVGCHIYDDIWLVGCTGVNFHSCLIGSADVVFEGSIGTYFSACRWAQQCNIFDSYLGNTSTQFFEPNQMLYDGTPQAGVGANLIDNSRLTANVGISVEASLLVGFFTQAMADADQVISAANSKNNLFVTTGVNTGVRALTLTTPPAVGALKIVRCNCTGNGITVQFLSGAATATIAPATAAVIYGDGTNAQILLLGS